MSMHATEPLPPACEAAGMSAYTVVNLRELDDVVGDRAPGIEGRFGRSAMDSRDLGVSLWHYEPNIRSPAAHSHGEQEEAYVLVAGSGRALVGDEIVDLKAWDVLRVAPEAIRSFESGSDGMELIAVGGPRPEDGDGNMVNAQWPDD
jgi:mannose-6-phosphate isomerase-like protein (cupin superfamily)